MVRRRLSYDVVVIGGGLSGLMAAASAAAQGARTALVAEGAAALELSTGSIDLLAVSPLHGPVEKPLAGMAELAQGGVDHPYALLGAQTVGEAVAHFQAICTEMGAPYWADPEGRNQLLVGPMGGLRATYLTAPGAALPRAGEPIWVVGFPQLAEMHPGVVAEGLKRALPENRLSWDWVELPGEHASRLHPVRVAQLVDQPDFLEELALNLSRICPKGPRPAWVLFPAVLGLRKSAAARAALAGALGARIGEVPLLGPSIPGLRLSELLRKHLERSGVDLYEDVRIMSADSTAGRVQAVAGRSAAGEISFTAGGFVLATGGLLGSGLAVAQRSLYEPIFCLPVAVPAGTDASWASDELAPAGGHPFIHVGIRADRSLRPAGWANLYVCGRMLAGYDPYGEGSGGGVAIASGWLAGRLAGREAGPETGRLGGGEAQ